MKLNWPLPLILSLFILGCSVGDDAFTSSSPTSPSPTSPTPTGGSSGAPLQGLTYPGTPGNLTVAQNAGTVTSVDISWRAVSNATEYWLEIADNPSFSGATKTTESGTSTTHTQRTFGKRYYRVRACAKDDATPPSTLCGSPATKEFTLTLSILGTPSNLAVAQKAGTVTSVDISWRAVSDAAEYWLEIADNPSFSGATTSKVTGTSMTHNLGTGILSQHYYRVRACVKDGAAPSSISTLCGSPATKEFTLTLSIPGTPSNLTVAQNAGTATLVDISWRAVSNAAEYWLEIADNPSFSGATKTTESGTSTTHTQRTLGKRYYRVRACVKGGAAQPLILCGSPTTTEFTKAYQAPNWVPNVFATAATFKGYCEAPRLGNDHNGKPYTDKQGSYTTEKFWLRSWSNETYLWYNEIVDQDPTDSRTPQVYFNTLKTNLKTVTGKNKDQYHYHQNTAEYNKYTESGVRFNYGMRFKVLESYPPRRGVITYVAPNSPAANAGFARGDEFVEINGDDYINGSSVDRLIDGLYPSDEDPTHTFKMKRLSGEVYDATMTGEDFVEPPVLINDYSTLADTNGKRYGYLMLNSFGTFKAEKAIYDAFKDMANYNTRNPSNKIQELVVDLRYNGGGYVYIASQLGYAIAGNNIPRGGYFNKTVFNDKHPNYDPVTGIPLVETPFYNVTSNYDSELQTGLWFDSLNLTRVFILSTNNTCSASELVINSLAGVGIDVVLIGDTTCGKPYAFYSTDNCGTTYSTIQMRASNAQGFGEYSDGFIPSAATNPSLPYVQGCLVEDDFTNALGNASEALLKTALNYDVDGCPATASAHSIFRKPQSFSFGEGLLDDPRMRAQEMQRSNALLIEPAPQSGNQ